MLLTKWGEALDRERPLPEYPRPQLRRESFLNLNGVWDCAFTRENAEPYEYDGEIVVPFAPESALSGVGRALTVSTMMHGEYGIDDVCLSTLSVVDRAGVRYRIPNHLTEEETEKLRRSADCLRDVIRQLPL